MDDFGPYFAGVSPNIHKALVVRDPNGSPNVRRGADAGGIHTMRICTSLLAGGWAAILQVSCRPLIVQQTKHSQGQLRSDLGRSAPLIAFTVTGSFRSSGRGPGHSFSDRSAGWSRRSLQLTGAEVEVLFLSEMNQLVPRAEPVAWIQPRVQRTRRGQRPQQCPLCSGGRWSFPAAKQQLLPLR